MESPGELFLHQWAGVTFRNSRLQMKLPHPDKHLMSETGVACHDIVRGRLLLLCHRCDAYARSQCCSPPDSDASRCCASLQHFLFSAATLLLTSQPILQKNDISVHGLVILCTIQAEVGVETYQKYRDGSKSF